MEILRKSVHMSRRKSQVISQVTLDSDCNVPDARPDVEKLVLDRGEVRVEEVKPDKDRISLKIGLECEYFPDYLHWLKEVIREFKLDYIIFGNHHFHTDEKFPYFGRNTKTVDMLELYEESAIEGMESGLFAYFAHPDLFMRSYPEFDRHCKLISRHICRTAARLNLPLEYNIGYEDYNDAHKITTIPHPDFWKIAAAEGCTAIIGVDAHNNQYLETPFYYERANERLRALGIKVIDRIPFLSEK